MIVIVFVVMEVEKAIQRYLKYGGADTYDKDKEYGAFDDPTEGQTKPGVELKYYMVILMVVLVTPPLVSPSSVQSLAPYFES